MTIKTIFTSFPILESQRLRLRQMTSADAEGVFQIFGDPAVTALTDFGTAQTLEKAADIIQMFAEDYAAGESIRWGITWKEANRVIGTCGLFAFDHQSQRAEIGYDLAQKYWRQGIMHEALDCLIRYAFGTIGLHRVEAIIDPNNQPSRNLLKKLGFQEEGILRERFFKGGIYYDDMYLGLLRRDYRINVQDLPSP